MPNFEVTIFHLHLCTSVIAAVPQCLWACTQKRWRGASDSTVPSGHVKTVKYISRNISSFIQDHVRGADKGKSMEMVVYTQFLKIWLASVKWGMDDRAVCRLYLTDVNQAVQGRRLWGGNPKEASWCRSQAWYSSVLNGVSILIPLPSLFHERINCLEWHKSHNCGSAVDLERQPKEGSFQVCHSSGNFSSQMWLSDGAVCLMHSNINKWWRTIANNKTNKEQKQKETQEYIKLGSIFFLLSGLTVFSLHTNVDVPLHLKLI